MVRKMIRILVPLAVAALAACGPSKPNNTGGPVDEKAPEFTGGGQEGAEVGGNVYAGPYGTGVGSVIRNYRFLGFPRANVDSSTLVPMEMADFYNPTGTEVYPAGSPYGAGTPKPLAMILARSALWCGPCHNEAKEDIPPLRAELAPKGGEWMVMLGEGSSGDPATQGDLEYWTNLYNIDYPAVIDPNAAISEIVGADAWPGNVIVRTRDMKIVREMAGSPDPATPSGQAFLQTFRDVIDGKPVIDGD